MTVPNISDLSTTTKWVLLAIGLVSLVILIARLAREFPRLLADDRQAHLNQRMADYAKQVSEYNKNEDVRKRKYFREEFPKIYRKLGKSASEVLSNLDDDDSNDVVYALLLFSNYKDYRGVPLTEIERMFTAYYALYIEVNNGGFQQYFFNSAGDAWDDVLTLLDKCGDEHGATTFRKILVLFPGGKPRKEREERWKQLDSFGEDQYSIFDEFDQQFYDSPFPNQELAWRYFVQQKDEFQSIPYEPEEEAGPEAGDEKLPLEDWSREYYQPGGGDALLYYVVFGSVDTTIPVSRAKYRSEGIPDGMDSTSYDYSAHPERLDSLREGYHWEKLKKEDPELAALVSIQDRCIVLRGTIRDPSNLNYLRDTVGLVTHLLDNGGVAVLDLQRVKWWNPESWRETIFEPASAVPLQHTVILISEEEEDGKSEWIHTRGLRKFGRPDLSIHDVTDSEKEAILDLCERFIGLQAYGGVIEEGKDIKMNSLPDGYKCYHQGDLDDPDFNNVHIEILRSEEG